MPDQPTMPERYITLRAGTPVQRGDLWLRPTDHVWIETGTAHWGTIAKELEYARPVPDAMQPIS